MIRFVRDEGGKEVELVTMAANDSLPRVGDHVVLNVTKDHTVHSIVSQVIWDFRNNTVDSKILNWNPNITVVVM